MGGVMKVNCLAVVIAVLSLLVTAKNVMGDEIRLKSGDHITGIVKKMEDENKEEIASEEPEAKEED